MNCCGFESSKKCPRFRLVHPLVVIFQLLLTTSAGPESNDGLRKLVENARKNFGNQSSACVSDEIDLQRHSYWSVKENGFCGDGFLTDDRFDECSSISSLEGQSSHYCSIELASVQKNASATNGSACQESTIKLALCVPAACMENEFEEIARNSTALVQSEEEYLRPKTNSAVCYKVEEKSSVTLYAYVSVCLLAFVLLNIVCTVYDVRKNFETKDETASPRVKLVEDFSVVRNYHRLTDTSLPNEKPCIHFISICTMLLIVVGQQRIFLAISSGSRAYRMSSSRCVDVLFVISGFLTFYYGFKPMQKGCGLFLVISVVFRWLRMMPTYCISTLFVMYVLPNLGDGFMWKYRMQFEASICEAKFWRNVFCILDYFGANEECFSISWYIRSDLQLSAIGGVLLLILTKGTRAGLIVLSAMTIGTYILAVVYSVPSVDKAIEFQSSLYSRVTPYFIGFIVGLILETATKRDIKFSNAQKLSFLIAAYGLKIAIAYCDRLIPTDRTSQWSALAVMIYAAFSRCTFVLFEASMILIYYTCGLGVLNKVIQLKIIIPVGRLTYVTLLTSSMIQLFRSAASEEIMTELACSHPALALAAGTLIDIICAYLFGFLIHLFFEAPFSRISKRTLKHVLWMFAKPVEEVWRISSEGEPDEHVQRSVVDRKRDKTITDASKEPSTSSNVHDNRAFENDEEVMMKLR